MAKRSAKFWTGMILLTTNQVIGWGGMAICAALALKTGEKKLWVTTGVIIYALSWLMVPLGIILAGPEGVAIAKQLLAKSKIWAFRRKVISGASAVFNDAGRLCPWWLTYGFDNPLRRLLHKPEKILAGLVEPGMTVMDVGCGFGFFSIAMARMIGVDGRVIAVDVQEEALNILLKRAQEAQVAKIIQVHLATSEKINYSGQVDFILSFWMAHEVNNQPAFFREIISLLKPGAKYLLVEPTVHVSAKNYNQTVAKAAASGLKPVADVQIAFSRAKLFII